MKKIIGLFAVILAVSIIGCKNANNNASENNPDGGSSYIGTKAPSEPKAVLDIVFNDDSAIPYSENLELTPKQKVNAMAIIYKVDGSKSYGMGVTTRALSWCTTDANAYNIKIENIICTPIETSGSYTFSGDTDGSDNFQEIASALGADDDTNIPEKYPVFTFAKNYGTDFCSGTAYETGWYIPSIAEMYDMLPYYNQIRAALRKIDYNKRLSDICWSSSQYDTTKKYAYLMYWTTGPFYPNDKALITKAGAYCVHVFN